MKMGTAEKRIENKIKTRDELETDSVWNREEMKIKMNWKVESGKSEHRTLTMHKHNNSIFYVVRISLQKVYEYLSKIYLRKIL